MISRNKWTSSAAVSSSSTSLSQTKLNRKSESKKYCMFYNRFGRCTKIETCPYIHDPKRIAICPRFKKFSFLHLNHIFDGLLDQFFKILNPLSFFFFLSGFLFFCFFYKFKLSDFYEEHARSRNARIRTKRVQKKYQFVRFLCPVAVTERNVLTRMYSTAKTPSFVPNSPKAFAHSVPK